ncbi:MAG TPA: sulfur transferase domain-containing protein, partial [Allosphingosinicella sp.]|nr:sulfur transferase domain-containing protein [Allosphingosinicella sp.]
MHLVPPPGSRKRWTPDQVRGDDSASAGQSLEQGPVLAFCRSGTRSVFLWALARAAKGTPAEESVA